MVMVTLVVKLPSAPSCLCDIALLSGLFVLLRKRSNATLL